MVMGGLAIWPSSKCWGVSQQDFNIVTICMDFHETFPPFHMIIFIANSLFHPISLVTFNLFSHFIPCLLHLTHSQLLEGFKSESKWRTAEGGRIGARSLAHNTLKGRGACWSSGMGLGRVDKLHSLTRACTWPTQGG
jgi:hypothetical protein